MANLYDIKENVRWLQYLAEMSELNEEQQEELEQQIMQLELDREEILEEYVKIIKNLEADIEAFAEAAREFLKKKHRAQKNVEYLRRQIIGDLNDKNEVKKRVGHFTIGTARTPGKIVIENEDLVSDEFKKVKLEVSKSAIQDHIKATGNVPDGVDFERGVRLSIR